jgi:hypothetical protein
MDPSSFSIEFQQGKEDGVGGFVVVCEWTGGAGAEKEEEKIGPGLLERGRFKYAFCPGRIRICRWLAGRGRGWQEPNGRVRCAVWPLSPGSIGSRQTRDRSPARQELQASVYKMWGNVLFIAARTGLAGPVVAWFGPLSPPRGFPTSPVLSHRVSPL